MGTSISMKSRLVIVMLLSGLVLIATSPLAEAGDFGDIAPNTVAKGADTDLTFTFENPSSFDVTLYWISAHFCWQSAGERLNFKENDGPLLVPYQSSRAFTKRLTVSPSTPNGYCDVQLTINATVQGAWVDWQDTVGLFVCDRLEGQVCVSDASSWAGLVIPILVFLILVSIVAVAYLAVRKSKRKKLGLTPPPPPQRGWPPQVPPPQR